MSSGLDQFKHSDKIAQYLKRNKGMSEAEIRNEIGGTVIAGSTTLRIHRRTDKVRDILNVFINGDIEEV